MAFIGCLEHDTCLKDEIILQRICERRFFPNNSIELQGGLLQLNQLLIRSRILLTKLIVTALSYGKLFWKDLL